MENSIQTFFCEEMGRGIRIAVVDDEPWFVAKDVCVALGISNNRDAVQRLDSDEKRVSEFPTPGGTQEMTMVNESGLYLLIFQSRKPEAKAFRKWVTSEVLPRIRKTGMYEVTVPALDVPRRSTRAGLNTKTLELLWTIDSMLMHGDVNAIAIECGVSRQTVHCVLSGKNRNPKVLSALYQRALDNSKGLKNNPYINPEKAIKKLLQ